MIPDLEEIKRDSRAKLESIFQEARELVRQGKNPFDGKPNGKSKGKGKERVPLKNGEKAPGFCVPSLDGDGMVDLDAVKGKRLLVIVRPSCPGCTKLIKELPAIQREHDFTVIVVSSGTVEENLEKFGDLDGLPFAVGL